MFGLESVPQVAYTDPWNLPLAQRLRSLCQGRQRVAYFYERADNSTFRYRVYNMAQVLNAQASEVSAGYFFLDDLPQLQQSAQLADLADLLVICRTRYDHRVAQLMASFKARGKRVLYDTDDLVFNPDYAHLLITTLDLDPRDARVWDDWYAYTARLGATLKHCDGAVTTNQTLAQRITEFANVPTTVIPNFLNAEQLTLSDQLFEAKRDLPLAQDGLTHLGYFSGSPSHNRDFAMVAPVLQTLLEEDDSLGVVVVGYIEPGAGLEKFGSRVKRFPFQDYVNLQKLIARVEYNLMPLQYNVFTNCKSELKYFDAAVVGTLSVASPTHTYSGAIQHCKNGFLAQAHEWLDVLRQALALRHEYKPMAEHARATARQRYAWTTQRPVILQALGLDHQR